MAPAPTLVSTCKVARAAPVLTKAPAAPKRSVVSLLPAPRTGVGPAAKMTLLVPPALLRAGTVTPPEQRSPTSNLRPDAALPTWPLGVRIGVGCPTVSASDDGSPRVARLTPTPGGVLASVMSPSAVHSKPALLYEKVDTVQLDALRVLDEQPQRAAWLLLSLKPPRAAPRPVQRRAPPKPAAFAPSRFRRNHQAMSKPQQDADGNYPCAHKKCGCSRVFGHAPASVAHSKACKMRPADWQITPV